MEVDVGGGLVNQVDGLVGQVAVGNIPLTHGHRQAAHVRADGHLVERFIIGSNTPDDLHRLVNGGLFHNDGLEAPLQGRVLFDVLAVFREGGSADDLDLAPAQGGLEDVGRVHGPLGIPGTHDGVDLVDD